jgi:hypothetical protein
VLLVYSEINKIKIKNMNYSCQEEHDYYESGAAQAQAEYEQQEAYYEFLNQLIKKEQYQLHAVYVALDTLSDAGNKDFNPAITFLVDLKNRLEVPKEPLTKKDIEGMPF